MHLPYFIFCLTNFYFIFKKLLNTEEGSATICTDDNRLFWLGIGYYGKIVSLCIAKEGKV